MLPNAIGRGQFTTRPRRGLALMGSGWAGVWCASPFFKEIFLIMEQLKQSFNKNGLPYTLLKRNEVVALYGVGGTFTDRILHYEVCKIHYRSAGVFKGKSFPESEVLPSNEQFGRDGSMAIVDYQEALIYFDRLTLTLLNKRVA